MESKVNYTIVGSFVIILTVITLLLVVWLSQGLSHQSFSTYLTYMNESVDGLNVNAPVKFNGVEVGNVSKISLVPHHPQSVRLTLRIQDNVFIATDTTATIQTQGLTGISYLALQGGEAGAKALQALPGEKYPVIQSRPSLRWRLDTALQQLSLNVTRVGDSLQNILGPKNQQNLQETVKNLRTITDTLAKNSKNLGQSLKSLNVVLANTAKASQQFPKVMQNVNKGANALTDMANNVSGTTDQVNLTMKDARVAIQGLADQALPETVLALGNLRQLLVGMRQLNSLLEQNPSVLLRGKEPLPPGPGEN